MASSDLHLGLVKLGNPVPVPDLIKANASDDRRVKQLRQLLLSQLDLIHKQSEVIAAKDQQIKELKRENESLQQLINAKPAKVRKVEQPQKEEPEGQGILTENPYYTLQNYAVPATEEIEVEEKKAEVPQWRVKQVAPCYIMEGTEDIEDETMLNRHTKPENDEKRRKRWDAQRIREQRNVARLRARSHDESEISELNELKTLLPDPEDAEEICVQDKIPVTVFGCLLPNLGPSDFSLPWLE